MSPYRFKVIEESSRSSSTTSFWSRVRTIIEPAGFVVLSLQLNDTMRRSAFPAKLEKGGRELITSIRAFGMAPQIIR
jgi:hypothetical protein